MSFELSAEDLTRDYGSGPVLEPLSFTLAAGERLAVIGESGCGKSTLLGLLSGMEKPSRGRVRIRFMEGTSGDSVERRPRSAFVWQNLGLFPWKRVLANLTLPLELAGGGKAGREARAFAMLDELGLNGLEKRWPASLSGGQRQRLALGRALIAEPDVLFLDEPFSALDALDHIKFSSLQESGWYVDTAKQAMENGDIVFAGKYSEPDYELLVNSECNLAIESTMILHTPKVQDMIEQMGIPVFTDRSSYETHPLGRTEWIKVYAEMVDKREEAQNFFDEQAKIITQLKDFKNSEEYKNMAV